MSKQVIRTKVPLKQLFSLRLIRQRRNAWERE